MAIAAVDNLAIWVLTPNGLNLGRRLRKQWTRSTLFISQRLADIQHPNGTKAYTGLMESVADHFHGFGGHIFIMSAGIVVRAIAPLLQSKVTDPPVVVVDDTGRFVISLIAGHIGGANALARQAAAVLKATPVITTATDANNKPAIDVIAADRGLKIETPQRIKKVNMALLLGAPVEVYDPMGWIEDSLSTAAEAIFASKPVGETEDRPTAGVWIDDTTENVPADVLVLRPPSLVAGIGCNRGTPWEEINRLLRSVLEQFQLSPDSLGAIASIDLKVDEKGLCALAEHMNLPLQFFSKEELSQVSEVPTPSAVVSKHIGVPSVCEAAAILASREGQLIVPKHTTRNVTVAIARAVSASSALVRDT
jgi:cobalt-precorrin 5A hydrolase